MGMHRFTRNPLLWYTRITLQSLTLRYEQANRNNVRSCNCKSPFSYSASMILSLHIILLHMSASTPWPQLEPTTTLWLTCLIYSNSGLAESWFVTALYNVGPSAIGSPTSRPNSVHRYPEKHARYQNLDLAPSCISYGPGLAVSWKVEPVVNMQAGVIYHGVFGWLTQLFNIILAWVWHTFETLHPYTETCLRLVPSTSEAARRGYSVGQITPEHSQRICINDRNIGYLT